MGTPRFCGRKPAIFMLPNCVFLVLRNWNWAFPVNLRMSHYIHVFNQNSHSILAGYGYPEPMIAADIPRLVAMEHEVDTSPEAFGLLRDSSDAFDDAAELNARFQ